MYGLSLYVFYSNILMYAHFGRHKFVQPLRNAICMQSTLQLMGLILLVNCIEQWIYEHLYSTKLLAYEFKCI